MPLAEKSIAGGGRGWSRQIQLKPDDTPIAALEAGTDLNTVSSYLAEAAPDSLEEIMSIVRGRLAENTSAKRRQNVRKCA